MNITEPELIQADTVGQKAPQSVIAFYERRIKLPPIHDIKMTKEKVRKIYIFIKIS